MIHELQPSTGSPPMVKYGAAATESRISGDVGTYAIVVSMISGPGTMVEE
ncbi:MAG: hypothetical protein ACTHLY_07210 [Pseudolabrys sp.]